MRIYLDHNATTPLRDEVVSEMMRVLQECYGNPSSPHAEGALARAEIEKARSVVGRCLNVLPSDIVFTGSATEANNCVLHHVASSRIGRKNHFITTTVEHPSVAEPLADLERQGWRVTRIGVNSDGILDLEGLERILDNEVALVSIIWANNETGVIQPVKEIASLLQDRDIPLHLDATQAVGKIPVLLDQIPATFVAASAHKFNGPKGVGILIARDTVPIIASVKGGPQEERRRGGTENLAGIVGLSVAIALATDDLKLRMEKIGALRDQLWKEIRSHISGVDRNGSELSVLPNTLNVRFKDVAGEVLLEALDLEGVSVSTGAACASGSIEPSHVLIAMGISPEEAQSSLRFSLGLGISEGEVARLASMLPSVVERVRGIDNP